jgi:rare lipoprotein A
MGLGARPNSGGAIDPESRQIIAIVLGDIPHRIGVSECFMSSCHDSFANSLLECSIFHRCAPVAQWIEYWPPKPGVAGSIPAGRTTDSLSHGCRAIRPSRPWTVKGAIKMLATLVSVLRKAGCAAGLGWLAPAMLVLGVVGCSSTPLGSSSSAPSVSPPSSRLSDGPPPPGAAPDPLKVPDAEPRVEPIVTGGPNKPYEVLGQSYVPMTADEPLVERGLASWYGRKFHGRRTASGETYNMYAMTAAHKTMPIPSYARVTNPANGREVVVRINDRGPFSDSRVVDLSWAAAVKLGVQAGVQTVEVRRLTHDEIRAGTSVSTAVAAAGKPVPVPAVSLPVSVPAPAPAVVPSPVAAVAVPPDVKARAPTVAAAGFWLQLGAFSRQAGAIDFYRRVAGEMDWLSPLLAVFAEGGVHRLQAGPYGSREQAREAADKVRSALSLVPVIVERR